MGDLLAAYKKNNQVAYTEFGALDKIANRMKACILKCQDMNIYSDIQPFEETAVIIRNDKNKDIGRAELIANVDKNSYINGCYIKSPMKESLGSEPSGLMIAT